MARTLKAGELRVSWQRVPTATLGPEPLFAETFVTVIVDDGETPIVRQVRPTTTEVLVDGVARGGDLEIAAAVTRRYHLLSEISRLRLRATQTRSWDRPRPVPKTTADPPAAPPPTRPFTLLPAPQPSMAVGYNLFYWLQADGSLDRRDEVLGEGMLGLQTRDREADLPVGPFQAIDFGYAHGCAMQRADQQVICWGTNNFKSTDVPPGLGAVKGLSVGGYHTCAVRQDDTLECWGWDQYQQSAAPTGTFHAVSNGLAHTCGLRTDGTVTCWGLNNAGQTSVPENLGLVRLLAAGELHNCAIKADDRVACWGWNASGQSTVPADLGAVKTLSGGRFHSCAVTEDDTPVCWGDDRYGQRRTVPASGTWEEVRAGHIHSCGRRADDTVECWRIRDQAPPTFSSLAVTSDESCGLRTADNFIQCWGKVQVFQGGAQRRVDGRGVYPRAYSAFAMSPLAMCGIRDVDTLECWGYSSSAIAASPPTDAVKAVALWGAHACAVKTDDTIVCWGSDEDGRATVPDGLGTVKAMTGGNRHTCALKTDDTVVCWGKNDDDRATVPDGLGTVKAVAGGLVHTCALKTDDTVVCWGGNNNGQTTVPEGLGTAKALVIAQNGLYSCAIKANDTLACWGRSGHSSPPETVPDDLGAITTASAGGAHVCALKPDNTVRCWGDNTYGETEGPRQ